QARRARAPNQGTFACKFDRRADGQDALALWYPQRRSTGKPFDDVRVQNVAEVAGIRAFHPPERGPSSVGDMSLSRAAIEPDEHQPAAGPGAVRIAALGE